MKSCVKICSLLASAQTLPTATRGPTTANYVNRVNAGLRSSGRRIKKVKIPRGIKTATARDGLKITGKWQST